MATITLKHADFREMNLKSFLKQFPHWKDRLTSDSPTYSIPAPAIQPLSTARRRRKALFSESESSAELAFTKFCEESNLLGFWNGAPICLPVASAKEPTVRRECLELMGLTTRQIGEVNAGLDDLRPMRQRIKGVMGWLLTDPGFLDETQGLKQRWKILPIGERVLPLQRPRPVGAQPPTAKAADPALATFTRDLNAFLDKWGLTQMVTWELPEPQGPLVPNPLPPSAPATPAHGIHVFIPVHYHFQQNDDLIRKIEGFQQQLASELQIPSSFAGLAHPEAYARIFDVLHIERSIISRLPNGMTPRGDMGTVEEAICRVLETTLSVVRQARKAISLLRRGLRDKVSWLKPRVR
ncbi:MAG: hypothetical protein WCL32_23380 [Planctomycetota bacterium]